MITHYVNCISNSEKDRKQIGSEKAKYEDQREQKNTEYQTNVHDLEQNESQLLQTEKKKIEIGKMLSGLEKERVKMNYEIESTIKDLSNIEVKKGQYENKIQKLEEQLEITQTKVDDEKEKFKSVDIEKSKQGSALESVEAKLQFLNSNLNQFKKFKSVEDRNK
jgi:chromosome segregation ATPase